MKRITSLLIALCSLSALTPALAEEAPDVVECTSNAPARIAEGTAIDRDGDAAAEAERHAVETAEAACADEGHAVFLDLETRASGATATSTLRFVCSASC